jgi:hypothetical protein
MITNNNNDLYKQRCWICYTYMDIDEEHPECEIKMEKMYAISKLLENRVITKEEYKEQLRQITSYIYYDIPR